MLAYVDGIMSNVYTLKLFDEDERENNNVNVVDKYDHDID